MSELVDKKLLFGQKAIQAAFISEDELQECLAAQEKIRRKKGSAPRIGEILVHKAYMTKEQVVQILRDKWSPIIEGKFGEIAVALELVSTEELDRCIKIQNKMRKADRRALPIGQIMVQEGLLRPNAILRILSFQNKTVARCPQCGGAYNIEEFKPGVFNCSIDGGVLEEVKDLEGMAELAEKEATQKTVRPLVELSRGEEFGRFKIITKLGFNVLGDCYLAQQSEKDREVILRLIEPVRTLEPVYRDKLLGAVERAIALAHTNVRRVYMVGRKRGYYYLAMEYVDGTSLRQTLLEKSSLPYPQALDIVKKIAAALQYGETRGLRHGDLRPANVILGPNNHVSVLDLGIPVDPKEMFRSFRNDQELPGFFIAPEVVLNAEVDARADIFSLGCIFYNMLTGRAPFRGRSTVEILDKMTKTGLPPLRSSAAHTPQEACEFVEKLLALEADDRPGSWESVIESLDALPIESKKTSLGNVDYSTFLGENVSKIGDEEIEKARLMSGRRKRKTKKKADDMSYSQLIESMRAGGGEEEARSQSETASRRATLEDLATKKPVRKHEPVRTELKLSSRSFWLGLIALVAAGSAVGGFLMLRTNSEFRRRQSEMDELASAEDDATQKRLEEKKEVTDAQTLFRRRQIFDQECLMIQRVQDPAFHREVFQELIVMAERVRELRGAESAGGDVEMVLGRAYFYQIFGPEFRGADASTRREWLAAAREHLGNAIEAYGSSGATTLVGDAVSSPDDKIVQDLRLHLAPEAPERRVYSQIGAAWYLADEGIVDYKRNASMGRRDAECLLAALDEYAKAVGEE